MSKFQPSFCNAASKIGFHYFPDTLHYQQSDLRTWLPHLQDMHTSWLVLKSETRRAIPEFFITELLHAGIEPVIAFHLALDCPSQAADLSPLLRAYQTWGVKGVILSERPNSYPAWQASSGTPQDLAQHFLSRFLPLAKLTLDHGLNPFLPPLEPGGNYWDTIFLRTVLQNLLNSGTPQLLDQLVLTAYAWTHQRPLNWGAGGPAHWPNSRPYQLSPGQEDHRGFRIAEWYRAICEEVLGRPCPIFLLQAGAPHDPDRARTEINQEQHTDTNLAIARLLLGEKIPAPEDPKLLLHGLDDSILACNFWLLAAEKTSPAAHAAWFEVDGSQKPIASALKDHLACARAPYMDRSAHAGRPAPETANVVTRLTHPPQPVSHYLLLPPLESAQVEALLQEAQSYIQQFQPAIGFSLQEAVSARHVSLVAAPASYSVHTLEQLAAAGCEIQHLCWNGTVFAP